VDAEEAQTSVANKLNDLAVYNKVKDQAEHMNALMDRKKVTSENFICTVSSLLKSDR
jgi:hypothetical protein